VTRSLPSWSPRWISALAALGLFVALATFGHRYHWVEEAGTAERDGFVTKAEELLDGRVPRDPFRPLLYPSMTAGLAKLGLPPFIAARLISNASAVALVLLAWAFGRRLDRASSDTPPGGLGPWAAAATAVNPNLWILGQHVTTDMLFAALAGSALLAGLAYLQRPRLSTALLGGLLYGAATFTRGNAMFLLPALVAAGVLAWLRPVRAREASPEEEPARPRWIRPGLHALLAAGGAALVLVPHWALRAAAFGDPFRDENWKNLAWKLYGYPDWSYLDRVPFTGLWGVVTADPLAVLRGGVSELVRFFWGDGLGGGLSQLLGTPLHALLFVVGALAALRVRPRVAGWLLFAAATFLGALAFAFFAWGRLLLALLPIANALAFAAVAGEPGVRLRGWVAGWTDRRSSPGALRALRALATLTAAGLVALLAVKTFAFRLPAFVERHPYDEIAVLRELEERDRDPGLVLAGTSPFLGRYLDRPYLALPDAFGEELEHPQRWFDRVRPELERAGVRFVVVGAGDLRDRPRSLLGDTPPVDWLEPVDGPEPVARAREEEVAVWKVSL